MVALNCYQNRPLYATACELLVEAGARLRPCYLRQPDETGLGRETPEPATRHPVTERSEVEVPRSDNVFGSGNIPSVPGQQQPATKTPGNGRPGRRGVEERQRSRNNIPEGKALGDGRRPAVGLPEGTRFVYICNIMQ